MSTAVTDYKCPACSGPLRYDGALGKLKCDYCDSEYEVAEIEALYAKQDESAAEAQEEPWKTSQISSDWGDDAAHVKVYSCPSCGAELICDETTAATACPYCGNQTIVPKQLTGEFKPDYVIPFKLGKDDAITALKNHYKGKRLLPNVFKDENHIEEIKGMYVPFWLFDGKAAGDVTYVATRSFAVKQGEYLVTTTQHYSLERAGDMEFEKIPVDASVKMPDDYMDSLEPFDYGELKQFSTGYLPGFLAERYDVSVDEATPRANKRAERSVENGFRSTCVGYSTVAVASCDVNLCRGEVHYALLPVWMLTTRWKDKSYMFAMNGQTGKLIGDLPVDKKKLGIRALLSFLIVFLAVTVLGALLM